MAKSRKSPYERLAAKEKEAEQAENAAAALRAQIRETERRKDDRRKILGGAMAFAHARLDLVFREQYATALQKAGAAAKGDRAKAETAELVKWVRSGCPTVDIDQRIEEMAKSAANTPSRPTSGPSAKPEATAPKS